MKSRFSIRRLMAVVMAVSICLFLGIKMFENQALKARLTELQALNQNLVLQEERLIYLAEENRHFDLLRESGEMVDVALNSQWRKLSTQLEIENTRNRIGQLLNQNDNGKSTLRKREILSSEIAICEKALHRLNQNPISPAPQIRHLNDQIARLKAESDGIAK